MIAFERLAEGQYQLTDASKGVVFDVSRLRRERFDLVGELAASCKSSAPKLPATAISPSPISTSRTHGPGPNARACSPNGPGQRSTGRRCSRSCVSGSSPRNARARRPSSSANCRRQEPEPEFSFEGFTFPRSHPTILFADGGTAKSLFAMLLGRPARAAGPDGRVLRLGVDAWTHRQRLESLFGPIMPALRYLRCDRPLVYEADRLAQAIRRDRLDFAVFDSSGSRAMGRLRPPKAR